MVRSQVRGPEMLTSMPAWQDWQAGVCITALYRGCSDTGSSGSRSLADPRSCCRTGARAGAPTGASGWYPPWGWAALPHQRQVGWDKLMLAEVAPDSWAQEAAGASFTGPGIRCCFSLGHGSQRKLFKPVQGLRGPIHLTQPRPCWPGRPDPAHPSSGFSAQTPGLLPLMSPPLYLFPFHPSLPKSLLCT